MTLTALTCMYEKPLPVMEAVLQGLNDPGVDERIVVLDRPSDDRIALAITAIPDRLEVIEGPPGWRSPCISWNAGLKHATGDHLLILQGDVVLNPGSVAHVRQALQARPAAYFGQVLESDPAQCTGPGHAGPVLCAANRPRPLTYLLALPTSAVQAINGWDEAFQAGVWYEDDDFTARLWKHGLDFVFDDRFSAIHQSHPRAYYNDFKIATNQTLMLERHGTLTFFQREARTGRLKIDQQPGLTIWSHQ